MGFGQEGFGWKYMCYSYRVEVVLAGGDLEDEWLTIVDGQLKANVGGVYSGIDVRVDVGFNLHTIDDFFLCVVYEGREKNKWFLVIVDNRGEKLDCVESLSFYGISGARVDLCY